MRFQNVQRPDLMPLALLVRKFGAKIEGGGYEVIITQADSVRMLPTGTFQEHRDPTTGDIHWQYFPNPTIDVLLTPESVTPESEKLPEPKDEPDVRDGA
jgi:hypothetical protein